MKPSDIGLPEKFQEYRRNQEAAIESIVECKNRFLLQSAPTGSGKSLVYMSAAALQEGRTCILTSTKGLQEQLLRDFGSMPSVTDMRGRSNYSCRLNTAVSCDIGLCVFGVKCRMKEEQGCFYYDALSRSREAKIVITNYSYWLAQNEYADGIGSFKLLVLDEAHDAFQQLTSHLSITFSKTSVIDIEVLHLSKAIPQSAEQWVELAVRGLILARAMCEDAKERRKEKLYGYLKQLVAKLERVEDRVTKSWVWEDNGESVTLSPVRPAAYAETALFMGTPKVLLTSATLVPETGKQLGVSKRDMKFEEFPHTFPVENRPLIHIPTVRMNYKNTKEEEDRWLTMLDKIIDTRRDRKGIIHTVSYARRDLVMARSKHNDIMITHARKDTEAVVRTFKTAPAPLVLVSPSMATGWDFPDEECRWQVIVKLPFPDMRGEIMKALMAEDKNFINYLTMQQLIQATGRGTRNQEDFCETFILDDNIVWFIDRNKSLAAEWFVAAYKSRIVIPKPIIKKEN